MKKKNLPFHLFVMTLIVTDAKWPKTAGLIGVEKLEQDNDGVYLMEDHLNKIESTITANETAIAAHAPALQAAKDLQTAAETKAADLQAKLDAANTALTTATGKLTTAEEKITELDAKLAARATDDDEPGKTGGEGKDKPTYSWTKKVKKINK